MGETFLFVQKLLKETVGIFLSQVRYEREFLLDFLRNQTDYVFDFLFRENHKLWQQLLQLPEREDMLYQWVMPGGIHFLFYAGPDGTGCCFGPVLTQSYSREEILSALSGFELTPQLQAGILQFCSRLPVVSPHTLYRTADLVIGHLAKKEHTLQLTSLTLSPPEKPMIHTADENIVQMRQVETRYEYSAALTDAVRQGNLSLALHLIGSYDPGTQTPVRNTNPLRNAQNYCIVLNTQLRHALEQSGIHPYSVDRLSNQIGMEIEQLKSTRQIPEFFQAVLQRYCRLVQEHTYPNLKPLTHLAVTYIKEHLADNLTVKDTAEVLTVNANYLSSLFHRDMGMTFIDFVNKERTNQAAALIRHTNLQIQQIASIVGYNNTSYFTKQFLRFHGVTPSHYRRESL